MSFENVSDEDIKFRTDNPAENFHKILNNFIDANKPKISYFIEHFKKLISIQYNNYITLLNDGSNKKREKFFIADDIDKFLIELNLKKIDFINLQLENNNNDIIYSIGENIFKVLFNTLDYDSEDNEKCDEKDILDSDSEDDDNSSKENNNNFIDREKKI